MVRGGESFLRPFGHFLKNDKKEKHLENFYSKSVTSGGIFIFGDVFFGSSAFLSDPDRGWNFISAGVSEPDYKKSDKQSWKRNDL